MAAIAFDTHEHIKALMKAGMPEAQAEAVVNSQKALADSTLVTKSDLTDALEHLHDIKASIKLMQWMLTVLVGGMIALLVKGFF